MYRVRPLKKTRRRISQTAAARVSPALSLIKGHNKIYSIKNDFIGETAVEALSLLTEASFNELYMNSFSKSRLSVHDDYLIGAYSRLMKGYASIINYYGVHEREINDQHSKIILRGIRTIFYTRISEYKEADVEALAEEKSEQAGRYLRQFTEEVQKLVIVKFPQFLLSQNEAYDKCMWDMTEDKAKGISQDIVNEVIRLFSGDIYDIYKSCSNNAMYESIKKKERDRINNCFERVKQEYDILGAVVKVQAPELEKRNEKQSVVNKLLTMVKEHYQRLGSDINHIEALYRQAESGDSAKDDFYTFLGRVGVFVNSKDTLKEITDKYILEYVFLEDDFDQSMKAYLLKSTIEKLNNFKPETLSSREKKDVGITGGLVNNIISEFKSIISGVDLAKLECDDIYLQIASGICETLEIKIQSMEEMLVEYMNVAEPIAHSPVGAMDVYGKDTVLRDIENVNKEYKQSYNTYFDDGKLAVKLFDSFLRKASGKIKFKAIHVAKKKIETDKTNIVKMDFRFKKECIFFEMITFEEIINYSVTKLKESENAKIIDFAEIVLAADNNIKRYMHDCGIETIKPLPHEMFNGRIHEVLMAKVEDGFQKGEIIKVVNNGYKQNGVVFARANVICAK